MKISPISILFAAAFALGIFAVPGAAAADEAKDSYDKGVSSFTDAKYAEAAAAFRKAYELKPSWKLLYNIGQSEAASKKHGLALEAFESYLAEGGDDVPATRREEVLSEVERLRKMVGQVEIDAPEGAVIFIDGVDRGTAPLLGKVPVGAGVKHTAWATVDGTKIAEKAFKVMGMDSISIALKAEEEGPAEPDVKTDPDPLPGDPQPLEEGSSGLKTGGWVMVGVGGAMVITGVITGVMAYKKDEKLYGDCPDEHCPDTAEYRDDIDSVNSLSLVTDVMLFGGGAIAATGAIMLIVDASKNKESEAPVEVAPAFGPGFNGATIRGRF